MAIRTIVHESDPILRKKSKPVDKFDQKLWELLDDMEESMRAANGVGLAAPQVGFLKRVVVIDVGEGKIELINPMVVYQSKKEIEGDEGCLSSPGEYGVVPRPAKVTVKAQDRMGNALEVTGEGFLARALCHEIDHLEGVLFKDLVIAMHEPEEPRARKKR